MGTIIKREGRKGTSYRVQLRRHGKLLRNVSGSLSKTFSSYATARKWMIEQEALLEKDTPEIQEPGALSFGDLLQRYENEIERYKAESTIARERSILDFWKKNLGSCVLTSITPSLINQNMMFLSKNNKPSTVRRYFCTLSAVFAVAVKEWDLLQFNSCLKVRKPKQVQGPIRYLSAWERECLLKAAQDSRLRCMYPLIVLGLDTGARKSELLNLRWADVDIGNQRVTYWRRKSGSPHTVPISEFCLVVLVEWHQWIGEHEEYAQHYKPSGYVFQNVPGKIACIRTEWYRLLKVADIEGFKFHNLRSSCAVDILNNGGSLMAVKAVLGHASINATMAYSTLAQSTLHDVIEAASRKFQ